MQRRELIQAMTAVAASTLLPATVVSGTVLHHPLPSASSLTPRLLAELGHGALHVKLFSDATAIVTDQRNGAEWRFGPVALQEEGAVDEGAVWSRTERSICEQYPGRFSGVAEGKGYRFWVLDTEGRSRGSFHAALAIEGDALVWRILQIDASLPSLSFPPPLECESLVLPQHIGRWVRSPLRGRYCWPFFSVMNMRWFGGLKRQKRGRA
jgi:hypothetical protein